MEPITKSISAQISSVKGKTPRSRSVRKVAISFPEQLHLLLRVQEIDIELSKAMEQDDVDYFESRLKKLSNQKKRHLLSITDNLYAQYDRIRKAKGGIGIVKLDSKRCSGCNMLLPSQVCIEVRKEQILTTCTSCQRMLCWRSGADA